MMEGGPACQRKHERDGVIGDFGRAVIGHVADRHTERAETGDIDIVEADAVANRDPGARKGRGLLGQVSDARIVDDGIRRLRKVGWDRRRRADR